jgi:hypothetical protein
MVNELPSLQRHFSSPNIELGIRIFNSIQSLTNRKTVAVRTRNVNR